MRTDKKNKSKEDLARERRKIKAEKRKKKGQDLASIRSREASEQKKKKKQTRITDEWRPDELSGSIVRVEKSGAVSGEHSEAGRKNAAKGGKRSRRKGLSARLKEVDRRKVVIVIIILLFLVLIAHNVIRLQYEQMQLKKQNEELKEQEKDLRIELENINSKEYIEKEARRQLRLVNPDEILFVFPGEEQDESNDGASSDKADSAEASADAASEQEASGGGNANE